MAKNEKKRYIDPGWPQGAGDDDHAVTELTSARAGNLSPYGEEIEFPLPPESLPYAHPHTVINR
ncbi:hypothetical protein [Rhodococcoides corynebacterioides]|uniref:Uncharacterized protein n=1 Tax=Rhodococcoides corynebacterioides TaxID=53972 RepID=A0ABS7NZ72_9NOCA|nr:hypothetical protein [Rhodococcus corynebacterioides]MBY6365360.1 hypothetical protein [Rhodococcus corynebacterioides]MBY6408171.1 hypothetical protein [Rhodococcus corynebacterioides]